MKSKQDMIPEFQQQAIKILVKWVSTYQNWETKYQQHNAEAKVFNMIKIYVKLVIWLKMIIKKKGDFYIQLI